MYGIKGTFYVNTNEVVAARSNDGEPTMESRKREALLAQMVNGGHFIGE